MNHKNSLPFWEAISFEGGSMKKRKIALMIVPILLFIMLAICIQAGVSQDLEIWAYSEAVEHMSPVLTSIVKFVTHLGDGTTIILICFALLLIPKTRVKFGLPISLSVVFSETINLILKRIFERERPNILRLVNETSYSFPSGHAMVNAAVYTMAALLVIYYIKDKRWRTGLLIFCSVMPIMIGYTRVYLGVHYAGDVIGGWLLGFAVSFIFYTILKKKVLDKENTEEKKVEVA